jgi:hypothetical protein
MSAVPAVAMPIMQWFLGPATSKDALWYNVFFNNCATLLRRLFPDHSYDCKFFSFGPWLPWQCKRSKTESIGEDVDVLFRSYVRDMFCMSERGRGDSIVCNQNSTTLCGKGELKPFAAEKTRECHITEWIDYQILKNRRVRVIVAAVRASDKLIHRLSQHLTILFASQKPSEDVDHPLENVSLCSIGVILPRNLHWLTAATSALGRANIPYTISSPDASLKQKWCSFNVIDDFMLVGADLSGFKSRFEALFTKGVLLPPRTLA